MIRISKSRYTTFLKSPRELWLSVYKRELAEIDASVEFRFEAGHLLGEHSKKLVDGTVDVTALNENGRPDIAKMLEATQRLLNQNVPAIAEASFSFRNMFASIDILKNNFDGSWDIYEVKSSSGIKDIYLYDIAFQKHLLLKCGLNIKNVYIVYVNKEYVRNGDVEIDKLFEFFKADNLIVSHMTEIDENVKKVKFLLRQFFEYAVDHKFIASNPVEKRKVKEYESENK